MRLSTNWDGFIGMRILSLLILAGFAHGVAADAEIKLLQFSICSKINGDELRLQCYDKAAGKKDSAIKEPSSGDKLAQMAEEARLELEAKKAELAEIRVRKAEKKSQLSEARSEQEKRGKWSVEISKSSIDDSNLVVLGLNSDKPIKSRFGKLVTPALILRCKENKTDVLLSMGFYTHTETRPVTMRFGKEKAFTRKWDMSTSHETLFHRKPIGFIRQAMKHEELLLKVTPYGENPLTMSFSIKSLEYAVSPLQKACNWK